LISDAWRKRFLKVVDGLENSSPAQLSGLTPKLDLAPLEEVKTRGIYNACRVSSPSRKNKEKCA